MDDNELMKEVNFAVDADAENKKKTKGSKSATANNLTIDSGENDVPVVSSGVNSENSVVLQELAKLAGTVKELSGLKDNIKQLECRVNNITNNPSPTNNPVVHRFIKCKSREDARIYCTHCALCGESGHKRRECPKNV